MEKKEHKLMVRFLFLTMLILEVLDDVKTQPLARRIIKKLYSLQKDFERIPTNVFNSLPKEEALAHTEIQLEFSKEFDKFYKNFLEKNNLTDGTKPQTKKD